MIRILAVGVVLLLAAATSDAQAQRALRGGLLGAGGGAIIGGIIDGGDGAAAGALIGGVTGAILGNAADREEYRRRNQGFYFNSNGRCFYEHPNGDVTRVANHPC